MRYLVIFLFLALPLMAKDELPVWVTSLGSTTGYPRQLFVTGFGMSSDDRKISESDKVAYARNMALADLAASLRVELSSENIVNSFSTMVNGDEKMLDEYKARVTAKTELNIDGVNYKQYTKDRRSYALAYLEKSAAIEHYRGKLKNRLGLLEELQAQGNKHLVDRKMADARDTYLKCDQVIGEIEDIILFTELLGDSDPVSKEDLSKIVSAKNGSRELWDKTSENMEDAAEQLAMKIAKLDPKPGKVQVNAFMLNDSYQYSQFSSRFRSVMEERLAAHTALKPLLLTEMDFTPLSAGVARHGVAANGADYLLSGTYFIKTDEIHFYMRLVESASGTIVASAAARMNIKAAGDIELKPRNFVQAQIDRKVFSSDEIVGGSLNLEVWTNLGTEGLAVEEEQSLTLYIRVNQPCYIRFIYHLANGARVVPEKNLMNYYIDIDKVNRVVTLPEEFVVCAPFGTETMQFFASTEMIPPVGVVNRVFDGEEYEVISDDLVESNIRYRGIKKKAKEVQVTEKRILLTTVAR